MPSLSFFDDCPGTLDAQFTAILDAVAASPPLQRPAIAVITGMRKPWQTVFSDRDYQRVREFGDEHRRNYPRAIAT